MKYQFTTVISEEDSWFVARAVELGVVSQGKTAEEAEENLKEAVELYLEHEQAPSRRQPPIVKSTEVEYA